MVRDGIVHDGMVYLNMDAVYHISQLIANTTCRKMIVGQADREEKV